jgi:PPOX class probable F420-dependent enzyme
VSAVRLTTGEAWSRLRRSEHGVLATVHPDRGVDAVPVVFAVEANRILSPVDTVKAKSTARLQRLVNLERDPRCALLVDHYEDDWSALWWVRVHGTATVVAGRHPGLTAFEQYREDGAVTATIVVEPTLVTGWRAG